MEKNILSLLSKEEQSLLEVKSVVKGAYLHREGELCSKVSIVVSGGVKIASMHYFGSEVIFNILEKGDIFGNNLIFSDEPVYKGDVVAIKDSTIVSISIENLTKLLQSNKEFLVAYLNVQSNFGKKLNSTIKMLSMNSAEDRFMYFLHESKHEIIYHSVADLADILNLKRETLSRLLTKLEKENIIRRSPHHIYKFN